MKRLSELQRLGQKSFLLKALITGNTGRGAAEAVEEDRLAQPHSGLQDRRRGTDMNSVGIGAETMASSKKSEPTISKRLSPVSFVFYPLFSSLLPSLFLSLLLVVVVVVEDISRNLLATMQSARSRGQSSCRASGSRAHNLSQCS